jgi:hypothetical protein
MPTDRYTKTVLSIIAAALLYIGAMLSGQPASAQGMTAAQSMLQQSKAQPVVIVGWGALRADGQIVLNTIRDQSGVSRTDSTLPVALQATREPVPVAIQSTAHPLPVSLGVTPQQPLPVTVTGVQAGPQWDEIRVRVDQPVRIDQPVTRLPGKP